MASLFLQTIINARKKSVAQKKGQHNLKELQSRIRDTQPTRPFQKAVTRSEDSSPRLIAEIKKASPSKGMLRETFHPIEIAKLYEEGGASAISVLTEEEFFLGKLSYLADVKSAVGLPILQKDFILDEFQIYEARAFGADAVLLIASLLTSQQISDYLALATDLSLGALVEVHTERELETVVNKASVIGINNRDLTTFVTDLNTTLRLMKKIPSDLRNQICLVSESGIHLREDVLRLAHAGVDALLIGETFMIAPCIKTRMRELF